MLNRLFLSSNRKFKNDQEQGGNRNRQPDWMRYAVIGFLLYAGVKVYFQNHSDNPAAVTQGEEKLSRREERQRQQQAQLQQQMDLVKQQTQLLQSQVAGGQIPAAQMSNATTPQTAAPVTPVVPAVASTQTSSGLPAYMQIGGDIEGVGAAAGCGQRATVKVDALLADGSVVEGYDSAAPARMTTIGNAALPWAAGLRGMKLGGVRQLIIPASKVMDDAQRKTKNITADAPVRFKLQLDKLEPVIQTGGLDFQAIDLSQGAGPAAACGEKIAAQVNIWAQDGSLATPKPFDVSFAVGAVPYFYGLDRGLIDMKVGGKRRLIVPPAYLQALSDNPTDAAQKPLKDLIAGGHTVILDVTLNSVEKAPQ